ncbi:amino acid ABC transporter permease [Paralcaligenes sp. KSB-10]|jgi:polar amino acid transport system permease protein|uniref:amino acid ABC transporter permease n=1 Tax=Paralcaligenes sp. KSB-10 TaxID=2901142 RepID=UPI001E3A68C4|nr:amino acid ABC transporter permease [Paralcaligenes sp. KSB-10]UHL63716.1 amino acid ABC transporter permease [Paralcaligenes sp. KSB-10]
MFDFHAIIDSFPLLIKAAEMTIFISVLGLCAGYVLAIGVSSARLSPRRALQRAGAVYVFVFRGVPLIVQLMMAYYFLPFVGINVSPIVASALAISLCEGAYLGEILRGGFLGIPRGQLEATQLLGFSRFDTLLRIEIPQALKLTMPSLINEMIMLVKASSLISIVGVAEITRTAQNIAASTFLPLETYVAAGCVYMVINGALSLAGHAAERRFGRS